MEFDLNAFFRRVRSVICDTLRLPSRRPLQARRAIGGVFGDVLQEPVTGIVAEGCLAVDARLEHYCFVPVAL